MFLEEINFSPGRSLQHQCAWLRNHSYTCHRPITPFVQVLSRDQGGSDLWILVDAIMEHLLHNEHRTEILGESQSILRFDTLNSATWSILTGPVRIFIPVADLPPDSLDDFTRICRGWDRSLNSLRISLENLITNLEPDKWSLSSIFMWVNLEMCYTFINPKR